MARKGKGKTKIVTTQKPNSKMSRKIGSATSKKVHRRHKGYGMRSIIKGQMTYKKKGRKR